MFACNYSAVGEPDPKQQQTKASSKAFIAFTSFALMTPITRVSTLKQKKARHRRKAPAGPLDWAMGWAMGWAMAQSGFFFGPSRTRNGQKCPSRSRGLDGALHNFCRIASFPARARFRTRLVTKPKRLRSFPSSFDSKKNYWPKTAIISCRSRKPAASWAVFQPLRMAKWPTSNLPF